MYTILPLTPTTNDELFKFKEQYESGWWHFMEGVNYISLIQRQEKYYKTIHSDGQAS